ncbi:MAG: DHH family phosphoesterase [Flavobacteriaceae bacterium]
MEASLQQLAAWLKTPAKMVIIPHKNPDGDAMGSTLALQGILEQLGHTATVIAPNDYPTFLHWLPGHNAVVNYENSPEKAAALVTEADVVFTLDFNTLKRIDALGECVKKSKAKIVMIDHHQEPDDYADLMFSEPSIGSTSELLYNIIVELGHKERITKDIASCLYTGILTDTGSFRFPSVTANTHKAVAELIARGADHSYIHEQIKDTARPDRLKLLGIALQNMVFLDDVNTAYITLSQDELDQCNFQKGDAEGFVNYGLSVSGIRMAVLMIEYRHESVVKLSFRSKGDLHVNTFAKTYFDGGGHINASGGISKRTLAETERHFVDAVRTFLAP